MVEQIQEEIQPLGITRDNHSSPTTPRIGSSPKSLKSNPSIQEWRQPEHQDHPQHNYITFEQDKLSGQPIKPSPTSRNVPLGNRKHASSSTCTTLCTCKVWTKSGLLSPVSYLSKTNLHPVQSTAPWRCVHRGPRLKHCLPTLCPLVEYQGDTRA